MSDLGLKMRHIFESFCVDIDSIVEVYGAGASSVFFSQNSDVLDRADILCITIDKYKQKFLKNIGVKVKEFPVNKILSENLHDCLVNHEDELFLFEVEKLTSLNNQFLSEFEESILMNNITLTCSVNEYKFIPLSSEERKHRVTVPPSENLELLLSKVRFSEEEYIKLLKTDSEDYYISSDAVLRNIMMNKDGEVFCIDPIYIFSL